MKRNALIYVLFSVFFLFVSSTIVYALDAETLPGKWHSEKKNAVFTDLDLKADGTGHFVNYAGKASEGKWTLDGNYLKFECDCRCCRPPGGPIDHRCPDIESGRIRDGYFWEVAPRS